ncbi:helicase-associated domain-containing protein [Saccharothrix sp. S26]|uniref:helicase-associated domain-containing protein n=1 Tax=Saccharothrix sp. S26 TaxID=2907215 RepID=UPI001F2EF4B5|nr:helicase-associated domain-containing protein [Saccharothrix sp. S26]MCE6993300.1 helicase-associated domain-containing protein [Saccharothrix sp. S26]
MIDFDEEGYVNAVDHSPEQVRFTEEEALANLRAVLELCAAGELRCSDKTGRPLAATVRTVGAHLVRGDFYAEEPIAAFAWPLLLQAGGLASLDGTRLRLTPKGRAALGNPSVEVIRVLWRRWLTHAVIDESSRVEHIKGQQARNVLTSAKTRRQVVAAALATCPPDKWVDVDFLFASMRRGNLSPTIARTETALWKLYLVDPEYGSLGYDGHHDWELLEGRYTPAVLFEYAGTPGLIDLDYVDPRGAREDYVDNWGGDDLDALSRYDGLVAVRLTALGAYALGLADTYQPAEPKTARTRPLKVLPNLDIVAMGDIGVADRLVLSAHAEQTADRVWTVSAAGLLVALDNGRDLGEFVDFVAERTEHDLPDGLRVLVADVERRSSQLTDLGHLRVIECADPALAALITRDRALRGLCRPIGDRHLAVRPDQELKFRKALLQLGHVIPSGGRGARL